MPTEPTATVWITDLGSRRPSTRLISAPSSGTNGIQTRIGRPTDSEICWSMLVPERGEAVDLDVAATAEDRDDDREPDRRLGGGHGDHDQREGVRRHIAPHPREREQRDVGGVEHELDRHQDDQRVAADEHARDADQEHHGGEHQEVPVADVPHDVAHATPPSMRCLARSSSGPSGRAIAIAPTTATSRRIEIAWKGNRPALNRSVPPAPTEPQSRRSLRTQLLSFQAVQTGMPWGAAIAVSGLGGSTCTSIITSRTTRYRI